MNSIILTVICALSQLAESSSLSNFYKGITSASSYANDNKPEYLVDGISAGYNGVTLMFRNEVQLPDTTHWVSFQSLFPNSIRTFYISMPSATGNLAEATIYMNQDITTNDYATLMLNGEMMNAPCVTIPAGFKSGFITPPVACFAYHYYLVSSPGSILQAYEIMGTRYEQHQIFEQILLNGVSDPTLLTNKAWDPTQQVSVDTGDDCSTFDGVNGKVTLTFKFPDSFFRPGMIFVPRINPVDQLPNQAPTGSYYSSNLKVNLLKPDGSLVRSYQKVDPAQDSSWQFPDYVLWSQLELKRECGSDPCQLGVCQLGLVASCDCLTTSFAQVDLQSNYQDIDLCDGETNFETKLWASPQFLKVKMVTLYDQVSWLCLPKDGHSFCGKRTFVIFNVTSNQEVSLHWDSKLFQYDAVYHRFMIKRQVDKKLVGTHNLEVRVKLLDFVTDPLYFPQTCKFTLKIENAIEQPVQLMNKAHQLMGSTVTHQSKMSQAHIPSKVVMDGFVTTNLEIMFNNFEEFLYESLDQKCWCQWLRIEFSSEVTINSLYHSNMFFTWDRHKKSLARKFTVGNYNSYDSPLNSECATLTEPNTYSLWVKCSTALKGKYLFLIGENRAQAFELMAYSEHFVQQSITELKFSPSVTSVTKDYQKLNTFNDKSIRIDRPGPLKECFTIESSSTTAEFSAKFNQPFRVKGVVVIPLFDAKTRVVTGEKYISNTEILTNERSCGVLQDATHHPEIICDSIANEVIIRRQCESAPCFLGLCSLGILSDCSCLEAGFTDQDMDPLLFNNAQLCRSQDLVTQLGMGPLYLPIDVDFQNLFDSVSLMCGNRDGITFCGARQIVVFDLDTSTEFDLTTASLFVWEPADRKIVIQRVTDQSFIGLHKYEVRIRLRDHKISNLQEYFPHTCKFTLDVQPSCQLESLTPETPQLVYRYILGSGEQQFRLSNYIQVPDCNATLFNFTVEMIDPKPGAPFPKVNPYYFSVSCEQESLHQQSQVYRITANAADMTNRQHLVTILFYKKEAPPYFVSQPGIPSIIPCFGAIEAENWLYQLPAAYSDSKREVQYGLSCSVLANNFFIQAFKDSQLYFKLNTDAQDVATGFYTCLIRLTDSRGLQSLYTVVFEKNCENPLSQENQQNNLGSIEESSEVKLQLVTKNGLLLIWWPASLRQIDSNRTVQQLMNITVIPGRYSDPEAVKLLNFSKTTYQENVMKIQLQFKTPNLISYYQKSKETLAISFNNSDFSLTRSLSALEITYQTITLPRQIGIGAVTVDVTTFVEVVKNVAIILVFLNFPALQLLLKILLGLVSSLIPITHYVLLRLDYPLNVQEFFGQIFPLLTFNLFDTEWLYEMVFSLARFEDGPYNDQFEVVGYTFVQAINNVGSVLLYLLIIPVVLILQRCIQAGARRLLGKRTDRVSKLVFNQLNRLFDNLKWNGVISFFTNSYMFISFLGWLQLKDQRFSAQYTATERFSSVLGYIFVIFSLAWPVFVYALLACKFRPELTALEETRIRTSASEANLGATLAKYHSQEQRLQFMDKYGSLLKDYRLDSKTLSIHSMLFTSVLQLGTYFFTIQVALMEEQWQIIGLQVIQVLLIVQLGYILNCTPYASNLQMAREIINLLTQLYLTYLMIIFTPFVPDYKLQQDAGNQFVYTTWVNIGINIIIGTIPGIYLLNKKIRNCRKQHDLSRQKKKINAQRSQFKAERALKQRDKATQTDRQPDSYRKTHKLLQNHPLNKELSSQYSMQVMHVRADQLLWDDSDQLHQITNAQLDQSANDQTYLLPMVTVQEIVLKDEQQDQQLLKSCGTEDDESDEESKSSASNCRRVLNSIDHKFFQIDEDNNESHIDTNRQKWDIELQNLQVYTESEQPQVSDKVLMSNQNPNDQEQQILFCTAPFLTNQKLLEDQIQNTEKSYVDILSPSVKSSKDDIQMSNPTDGNQIETGEIQQDPHLDMTNRDNWQRTYLRAFIPDPKATKTQMQLEALTYIDYIKKRLVITQWDYFPKFESESQLTLNCYKAYQSALQASKQRNPTPQQKALIAEQVREVRMEIARKIVEGRIDKTPQFAKEFRTEIEENSQKRN